MESRNDREFFMQCWCDMYGLTLDTCNTLLAQGINSGAIILALTPEDIHLMRMPMGQKCLLRGAILQYRECRSKVDRSISSKRGEEHHHNGKKKRVNDILRVKAFESLMKDPDRRELVGGKKHAGDCTYNPGDGIMLSDWIIQQRNGGEMRSTSVPVKREIDQSDAASCSSFASSPPRLAGSHVTHTTIPSSERRAHPVKRDASLEKEIHDILDKIPDKTNKRNKKKASSKNSTNNREPLPHTNPVAIVENLEQNLFTEEELHLIESIRKQEDEERKKSKSPSRKKRKAKNGLSVESIKGLPDDDLDRIINGDFDLELTKILSAPK